MEITSQDMRKIVEVARNCNGDIDVQTDVTAMSGNHMLEVGFNNSAIIFNSAVSQKEIDSMREILDEAEKAITIQYAIHDGEGHFLRSIELSDCGRVVYDMTENRELAFKTQNLETAKQLTKFIDGSMEVIR